ncbi:MAG: VRR-NUC domain-containing protein [Pseudomonadota bacterium]|nr:VRR-NUC domain-containing protein [Pseudomonadota bacterium]
MDLLEVIEGALVQEGHLFAAGERVVLERLRSLDASARELWARLSLRTGSGDGGPAGEGEGTPEPDRTPPVFRVASLRYDLDLAGAVATLAAAGLAHTTIPDDRCAPAFDVPALRAACVRLGLPTGGARAILVERLRGRRWVDEPVVMLAHLALVRRAELLYFQSPYVDRATMVVERIGQLRWPTYVPTGGPGLFRDRAALRAYERARAAAWTDADEPLRIVLAGRPTATLAPWRRALEAVLATDPAADVLGLLCAAGATVRGAWALRLDREGRRAEALHVCRAGLGEVDRAAAIALERTGKRLARALRQGWAPLAPLRPAPTRRLRLPPGPRGARPTWIVDGAAIPVEAAVVRVLTGAGRRASHGENWLWTSLYALVFRDLYFLPVAGMLPTARRDGPLDVGTPGFYTRRREAIDARLAALATEGPAPFVASWDGERLAGLYAGETVRGWSAAIPGKTAAAVLGRLAREGWSAARGLPDLYVFSGVEVRVAGAVPARLDQGDALVEIKGPGDSLRDEQRVWHDRLLHEGIVVELWEVAG